MHPVSPPVRPLLAVLLGLAVLSACGEPCDPDTDRAYCEGDTVVYCPQPGPDQLFGAYRWSRRVCFEDHVCVETEEVAAFCALDDQPDPACADGARSGCEDDTTRVWCTAGYANGRQDCLACTREGADTVCEGGFGSGCETGADCVSGECNPQGHCL